LKKPVSVKQKRFLIFASALIGLAYLANLLADNPYSHRAVRQYINAIVTKETNLSLDFKAIKVRAFPPGVGLYGINVGTSSNERETLVSASRLEARISLWSIFTGEPRLGLLEITDLQLVWPPPPSFPGLLKNPPPEPTTPAPVKWPPDFPALLGHVILNNARIFFETYSPSEVPAKPALTLATNGLDLDLKIQDWSSITLSLDARNVNAAQGPVSFIEDTRVRIAAELNDKKFTASRYDARGERIDLTGSLAGKILTAKKTNVLEGIEFTSNAEASGDFSLLGSFLDISDTRGPVKAKANTTVFIPIESASPAKFNLSGEGELQGAILGGFKLHNSRGKFEIDMERISFPSLDIIVGNTQVGAATGEIKFNSAVDYDFSAKTDRLHLMDLLNTFDVGFEVFDVELTSPDLKIRGRGDPFVLNATATLAAHDITLPATPYDHSRFPQSPACRLNLNLAVTVKGLDFAGTGGTCYNPATGTTNHELRPGQIQVPAGATAASSLQSSGYIWFDSQRGINLSIEAPVLNAAIGQYFANIPLEGQGRSVTRIFGPYSNVQIETKAELSDMVIMGMPLGSANGTITATGEKLFWKDLRVAPATGGTIDSPEGELFINGLVLKTKLLGREVMPATVESWIAPFSQTGQISFGVSRVAAQIEGPLLFPLAWQGAFATELVDAVSGTGLLFDRLQLNARASKNDIAITSATLEVGDFVSSVDLDLKRTTPFDETEAASSQDPLVRLGLHHTDEIIFSLQSVDGEKHIRRRLTENTADHLQRLPLVGEYLQRAGIRGQIKANAKLRGTIESVQGTVDGSVESLNILGASMAPLNIQAFVRDSKIDAVISHAGNALEGRFSADFGSAGLPYEWYFNFNRLDLRAFGTDFFYSDPRNFAYLTADWHMKGKLLDWWKSTGELKLDQIQIKYLQDIAGQVRSSQIQNEQPIKLLFTDKGWFFADDQDLFLSGKFIHTRISLPDNHPPQKLAVKMETILDMSVAKEFSALVESATGKIRILGEISGSVENLQSSFEITDLKANPFIAATWEPLSIGLADFRPPLRNIRIKANIKNGRLVVDSLTAGKGTGTVAASGSLVFGDNAPRTGDTNPEESRLDISFKEASVIYPIAVLKSFESSVSGNVSLSGNGLPWRLSGDVNIARARSTREVDIRDEIISGFRKQISARTLADKPTLMFDLNVNADNSININNRNIQALLSTNLQITGNNVAPVVSGQVEVEKGKFIYKRDFTVTRGVISFDDPVKPDPSLDILAVSEVKNYRVYIAITGKASNPVVDFSIDPPVNRNGTPINKVDIFVLLSRGDLPDENRASGDAADAAALEFVNVAAGMFEEPVERLFERSGQNVVRQVYIDIYSSPEGAPIPRFNLPLNLGQNLDVVLRVDQSSFGLTSEYALHDAVSLSGGFTRQTQETTGTEKTKSVPADTGVDLKFRFAFP